MIARGKGLALHFGYHEISQVHYNVGVAGRGGNGFWN